MRPLMRDIGRSKEPSGLCRKTRLSLVVVAIISLVLISLFGGDPYYNYEAMLGDYVKSSIPVLSTMPVEKWTGVQNAIRKTSGEGWEMWNRQAVVSFDWTCRWGTFTATNGVTAPMCVHPATDDVSNSIISLGRRDECDRLTFLWDDSGDAINEQSVYVEIGGNIGSCVMQMLLTTKAPIIVFEPDPRNQFVLTNTLMALSPELRDRVSLFPIALGSEKGRSTINAAQDNMGNAVVGTQIKDDASQQFHKPIPIRIERLDSILNTNNQGWNVPLLKIDAQGFECRIMDGMGAVQDHIRAIGTEIAQIWLDGQGCSDAGYLDRLRAAGFDVYFGYDRITGDGVLVTKLLSRPVYDVIALKQGQSFSRGNKAKYE